jgi:AcrR family transcriptional regulator
MSDAKGETWIRAGFAELARSGIEGVRIEVLAKNLGVTKGGFYRRFRDRGALLEGMLEDWREGRIAAIEQQANLEGESARERLAALIHLYSERMNTEGMAIELAIRQWARTDEAAAEAVASVDAARLKNVGQLYRATGLDADAADAKAFLFYCFVFGQSLLFLEAGQRKRVQLVARSAEKLLD